MTIQWPGVFFIAWGLYVLLTSLAGPDGYKRNYKASALTTIIGPKGARAVFMALGLAIFIFGFLVLFTVIDPNDDLIKWRIGGGK